MPSEGIFTHIDLNLKYKNRLKSRGACVTVENTICGAYVQRARVQDFVVKKEGDIEAHCGFVCQGLPPIFKENRCFHKHVFNYCNYNGSSTNVHMFHCMILTFALFVGGGEHVLFLLSFLLILHGAFIM